MATMKDLSMYVQEHLREYLPEEMQGAQIAVTDVQKNNGLPTRPSDEEGVIR